MNNEQQKEYTCNGGGGCSGTTPVWIRVDRDGSFEARVGFALMGMTNMEESEFEACGYNPFHPEFRDNYAIGKGSSEEEALADLESEMKKTGDSLWAI